MALHDERDLHLFLSQSLKFSLYSRRTLKKQKRRFQCLIDHCRYRSLGLLQISIAFFFESLFIVAGECAIVKHC